MENEIWKHVPGYKDYQVSNLGNVRSFKLGKNGAILKPRKVSERKPYCFLNLLNDNGKYQLVRVHRLVATAFVPKSEGMNIVNHLDANKLNNRADNLEWTNQSGNVNHAYKNGLIKNPSRKSKKVMKIKDEKTLETYPSIAEASRKNKINVSSITRACTGIQKTAGGFIWKYVE